LYQIDANIISKKQISEKHFLITFSAEKIANEAKPGQFVMIKIDIEKTFLRRPFSICSASEKTFNILFKVVGIGTEILSQKKAGDTLNIIGPLGTGYRLPITDYRLPILVAGGTGVASLLFLAQFLSPSVPQSLVFIGAKTKKDVLFANEFKKLGCKVIVSTEDGSYGAKGLVSNIFSRHVSTYQLINSSPVVYACGPKGMLKKIAEISKEHRIKCFVSLEEKMACGLGACIGCVVKIRTIGRDKKNTRTVGTDKFEYKRVCKDGPVFAAEKIIWQPNSSFLEF